MEQFLRNANEIALFPRLAGKFPAKVNAPMICGRLRGDERPANRRYEKSLQNGTKFGEHFSF
jgi:hypothetical protein